MKTRRHQQEQKPAHRSHVDPASPATAATAGQPNSGTPRQQHKKPSSSSRSSRRNSGQQRSNSTKRKKPAATLETARNKRPRSQPSPTSLPEAVPSSFHPSCATSMPWSSEQQQQASEHFSSPTASLHNHDLVGILEHILATGSVARAASIRHERLMSYLHHVNEADRTAESRPAIQSQEHYDRKHHRGRGGGHGRDNGDRNGGTSDGEPGAVTARVDSNPRKETETLDRITFEEEEADEIRNDIGIDQGTNKESNGESSSENAEPAATAAPTNQSAHQHGAGVWPSIDLEGRQAGRKATTSNTSNAVAARFAASLASDDTWELEYEDGFSSSKITSSETATSAATEDGDGAVLASLIDRCWQRAVHTMSSAVPYDPYGALYGPSHAPTAQGGQNGDALLAESSSSLVLAHENNDDAEEENRATMQSILEREAMFAIDSVLHLALTEGKKFAEQRVERSDVEGDDEGASRSSNNDTLTWVDIARVLSLSVSASASPSSSSSAAAAAAGGGAAPENGHNYTASVSSQIDILQSNARTVQVQASMPPVTLNEESLRSTLSRLSELFDPSLTMMESATDR